jgi:pseudouridine synthase
VSALPRRLSKLLADDTTMSHQEVSAAIAAGRVSWRGEVARDWDVYVMPGDTVELDGAPVLPRSPAIYAMLHKPAGVVSTRWEPGGAPTLGPWLDALGGGCFAVGRLDAETTGLLLITDDGDLSYMLLNPASHVVKEYHITARGEVSDADVRLARLVEGVDIGDGKHAAQALSARVIGALAPDERGARTLVALELGEGRYRQVRKMCRAVGLRLLHLHRVRVGPLELGALEPGAMRALKEGEVAALWAAVGGREAAQAAALEALRGQAVKRRCAGAPDERLERWLAAHP